MGAYMYPIVINRERSFIPYERCYKLTDLELTLNELKFYVKKNESFFIDSEAYVIYVRGKRLETDEEMNERIAKEELYMKNYQEFHSKK